MNYIDVPCLGKPARGSCKRKVFGFTFDSDSRTCKEFSGLCRYTKNAFRTREKCEEKCGKELIFIIEPTNNIICINEVFNDGIFYFITLIMP